MKRIIFALSLSIVLHIAAFAAVATVQLLTPPKKKPVKIMYIKPVTLPKGEIKKVEPDKPKPEIAKPKPVIKQNIPDKIAINPKPTPTPLIQATPGPVKTLAPVVFETPKPTPVKSKSPVKLTQAQIKEKENKQKIAILRKYPYFKNWPDARIKKLDLPPGMTSWDEATKLTEYFDTQYKWTYNPPSLGSGNDPNKDPDVNPYASASPQPTPESTPSPDENRPEWKEYKVNNNEYTIKFYKDDIGFITYFKDGQKNVKVDYFPFIADLSNPEQEIKVAENISKEEVKSFNLPLTKEDLEGRKDPSIDKSNKDQLVRDIIRTYNQKKLDDNN